MIVHEHAFIAHRSQGGDDKCAGKIGAENGEQKKFALGIDVGELCQIFAQMSLGQQVRKKRRHAAADRAHGRDKPAGAPLKDRLSVGRRGSSI